MDLDETIKKIDERNNINIDEEIIIAVSNSYISKFYLDKRLEVLPQELKDGIKVLMVTFTEENGGVLEMRYNDQLTSIFLFTYKDDNDFLYDDIAAGLKMQKLEKESADLFNNLSIFCKLKFHEVDKFMEQHKLNECGCHCHNHHNENKKESCHCHDKNNSCNCNNSHDGCCHHESCGCHHHE